MYSISSFGDMIADETRTDAYVTALQRSIRPETTTVLDIGTGTGIFALLACRFGASHVYALEPGEAIHVARQLATENGYADKITFIQDFSTHISLPQPVDVIISDLHGVLPFFQQHIPSIVDARQRLLAPNGILIPQRDTVMATVVKKSENFEEFKKPDVVKAVLDEKGNVLYFSRMPIPTFLKEGEFFYKHIGLYAFTKEFLFTFKKMPPSFLERHERLEQLRALENGYRIRAIETQFETIGIDTPDDLERARALMARQDAAN